MKFLAVGDIDAMLAFAVPAIRDVLLDLRNGERGEHAPTEGQATA